MITKQRKSLILGISMLIGFVFILILMFSPVFNGKTPMTVLDNLYNSISKGSVYYIDQLEADAEKYKANRIELDLTFDSPSQAEDIAQLLEKNGATIDVLGSKVHLSAQLGELLLKGLDVADEMFHNRGDSVKMDYGYNEKLVLVNWWSTLSKMSKELNKMKLFDEAKYVLAVLNKGIECSYNYYGIEPLEISSQAGFVILSLCFYVIYTVWFGFSIMYIFVGLGFKLEH